MTDPRALRSAADRAAADRAAGVGPLGVDLDLGREVHLCAGTDSAH